MKKSVFLILLMAAPLGAARQLDLNPGSGWVDTGVDLKPGDTSHISATGQLQFSDARQ